MKYLPYLYIIIATCCAIKSTSINSEMDLQSYKNHAEKLLNKKGCLDGVESYNIEVVFHKEFLQTPDKKTFTAENITRLLKPIKNSRNGMDNNYSIFFDQEQNVIAYSSNNEEVFCGYNMKLFNDLVRVKLEQNLDSIFWISGSPTNLFFGFYKNEIRVLKLENEPYIYSVNEFKDCCWDDFLLISLD